MYPPFASGETGMMRLPKRLQLRQRYREWRYRRLAAGAETFLVDANSLIEQGYASQCGQDKWLVEKMFPGMHNGVFVDIGAHDGVSFSNTLFLEQRLGWSGLVVEPMPDVFERLTRNRNCSRVNGCVANTTGVAKFRRISGYSEMLSGLVEQYDPRHLDRISREVTERGGTIEEISVECFRLNDLLATHGLRDVHYVNVDVEGAEYDILRGFDFAAANVWVWGIENNYRDYRLPLLMKRAGYALVATVGDEFYARKGAFGAAIGRQQS